MSGQLRDWGRRRAGYGRIAIVIVIAALIIFVTVASIIYLDLNPTQTTGRSTTYLSNPWSSLRGVNYLLPQLSEFGNPNNPSPSVSFPEIKADGWNLIRVPLSWNAYENDTSLFMSTLENISASANSNNLSVVYDFHAIGDTGWPSSLISQYPTLNSFYKAWWLNGTTYKGQNGWQIQFSEFWKNILNAVDSQPSTLGYEIMNEPPIVSGVSYVNQQNYNTFVATHMRLLTQRWIVFDPPFDCVSCKIQTGASPVIAVAPKGVSKVVIDAHMYGVSDPSAYFAEWASAGEQLGFPVWIGEWGVNGANSPQTLSSMAQILTTYIQDFKTSGFAWTYWYWNCGSTNYAADWHSWHNMLDSSKGCSQWWFNSEIVQLQA